MHAIEREREREGAIDNDDDGRVLAGLLPWSLPCMDQPRAQLRQRGENKKKREKDPTRARDYAWFFA